MKTDYIYLISSTLELCRKKYIQYKLYKDNNSYVLQTSIKNCIVTISFYHTNNINISLSTSNGYIIGFKDIEIEEDTKSLLDDAVISLYRNTFEGKLNELIEYIKEYSKDNEAIENFVNNKKNIDNLFDEN